MERLIIERDHELSEEIAERGQAERDLRQLQRRHELILDAITEGIHWIGRDGRIIFENPAAARMLGWDAEELLGQPAHATMHHSRADGAPYPQSECPIYAVLRDGLQRRVVDEVFWRRDGTCFPVEYTSTPIRDEGGGIIGAVVVFTDSSERERAEAALRESEARKSAILRSALDGIVAIDHGGRILEFNPAAEKIFGQRRAEVLGQELAQVVVPPSLRAQHRAGLLRYLATEEPRVLGRRIEITALRSDGSEFPIELSITRLGEEAPATFIGFIRDITERRRAEQQLNVQYAISRLLMETATLEQAAPKVLEIVCENLGWDVGALWRVDHAAGVLRCTEIFCAPALSAGEFIAASRETPLPRDVGLPGRAWASADAAWVPDVTRDANFPRISAAQRVDLHGAFAMPIRVGGEIDVVIEFFSREVRAPDESLLRTFAILGPQLGQFIERKRAEIELQQMHLQLLLSSRQAGRAEVATSVLHNVGNVLNSVNVSSTLVSSRVRKSKVGSLGRVAALLREHAADLPAFLGSDPRGRQLPEYLGQLAENLLGEQGVILTELASLQKNIEHIKEIVAMQQSHATISGVVETVAIGDVVEDALRMSGGVLSRSGVEIHREIEGAPVSSTDKHKVLQVLVNLARNAGQACDESGRADKRLTVRVAGVEGRVRISFIDNGVGIAQENLTRIFSYGFTTKKDGHGFGLHSGALAAQELGGSLTARSDGPGQGATFTLELPCGGPAPG